MGAGEADHGGRQEACRVIPKIPQCDITQNDVDRTIGLRNFEMTKLADAILAKEVSIKGNKLPGAQQRKGVTL